MVKFSVKLGKMQQQTIGIDAYGAVVVLKNQFSLTNKLIKMKFPWKRSIKLSNNHFKYATVVVSNVLTDSRNFSHLLLHTFISKENKFSSHQNNNYNNRLSISTIESAQFQLIAMNDDLTDANK